MFIKTENVIIKAFNEFIHCVTELVAPILDGNQGVFDSNDLTIQIGEIRHGNAPEYELTSFYQSTVVSFP